MPFPTIFATATPRTNTATKLKKAAQITAIPGVRTRVETTVAIELAASWKPFRKSKTRARTMTRMMYAVNASCNSGRTSSGVLDDDPLQNVGHVLAVVRRGLEASVDLLPLDQL